MVCVVMCKDMDSEFIEGIYTREDDAIAVCEAGNAMNSFYFWVSRINLDVFPDWFGR